MSVRQSNVTTESGGTAQGLVACAKSDRYARISVFSDLLTVHVPSTLEKRQVLTHPGRRAPITTFSKKSRNNLLRKLAKLRNFTGGFFITLTYPGEYINTLEETHVHLANFRKRLLRRFPGAGFFWRMEIKPRLSGASQGELVPHFHLLLMTGEPMSQADMIGWISRAWWEVVGSNNLDHLAAGTNVRVIENKVHAQRYVSKYAAKPSINAWSRIYPGRHWGTAGALDFACPLTVKLPLARLAELKRLAAKLLRARGSGYAKRLHRSDSEKGWSCFGLGDESLSSFSDVFDSTAMRMIFAVMDGE